MLLLLLLLLAPHQDEISRPPFATITDPAARKELVQKLHLLKTDIFMEMVESGAMPLRPGVARLVQEAIAAGEELGSWVLSRGAVADGGYPSRNAKVVHA